uniref:Uncharacterized protein n=1 Tax=Helianthus annuus TaxID=4232 RepID=A0A251UUS6_HELAN
MCANMQSSPSHSNLRLCCLNWVHAGFQVWLGRSPGKPYRGCHLTDLCVTTRTELSVITHGETKTLVGSGFELTTSHKLKSHPGFCFVQSSHL